MHFSTCSISNIGMSHLLFAIFFGSVASLEADSFDPIPLSEPVFSVTDKEPTAQMLRGVFDDFSKQKQQHHDETQKEIRNALPKEDNVLSIDLFRTSLARANIISSSMIPPTSQERGHKDFQLDEKMTPAGVIEKNNNLGNDDYARHTKSEGMPPWDSPDRWHRKPHPFYHVVHNSCKTELESLCHNIYVEDFYLAMSCLEKAAKAKGTKRKVTEKCKNVLFSGTGLNPNPLIFKEHMRKLTDISSEGIDGISHVQRLYGYIKAPLIFTDPHSTSLMRVWFQVIPCQKQPAPKGILFIHYGGPFPSMNAFPLFDLPESELKYILENYDLVITDQRGMGLSALDYVAPSVEDFVPTEPSDFDNFLSALSDYTGNLHEFPLHFPHDEVRYHNGPCYDLTFSEEEEDKEPDDLTNIDLVTKYLKRKGEMTSKCSKQFNKNDGKGGSYNILQFLGTQGVAHDIEWLRWALGSPKISILGYSYGSRVAAAYGAQFPNQVTRMAVSGVMGPIPDSLDYAREAARNTAEILGFVLSQCNAVGESCTTNPVETLFEEGFYFDGDINDAVDEMFLRSSKDSEFYVKQCGVSLPMHALTEYLALRTTSKVFKQGQFQDKNWPVAMLEIPAAIFLIVQNPCAFAGDGPWISYIHHYIDTFNLIPALDMAGRWSARQTATFIAEFAEDVSLSPSLSMFMLYARNANGWPQLPTPISFSNPDVEVVIAQPLYDQRTGMNMAQQFQLNFPKSNMVIAPVAGHCVFFTHGVEAFSLMLNFLLHGRKPPNGYMSDMPPKEMDFSYYGKALVTQCSESTIENCLFDTA